MSLINQVLIDLEKRHASESERPLPAHVRAVPRRPQSNIAAFVFIAVTILVVIVGIAGFIYYRSTYTAASDVLPAISRANSVLPSDPIPVQRPVAVAVQTAPVEEPPSRVPAFDPVSKLSDELTIVAPLSPGKQRLAAVEHGQKPARSAPVATLPKAEPLRDPIDGIPSQAEIVPKPVQQIRSEKPVKDINTPGPTAAATPPAAIDKQMREVAPSEGAEISFRKGVAQIQEGRANKAELEFRDALKQDPSHAGALQALLNLLLASGRNNDAEQLLRTALESDSHQPRLGMILARLEVERGEVPGAINTLVGVLPYVQSDSEFYAFLAALLQREGRHKEAVEYYRAALRTVPGNGVWTMGLGISLRASNQGAEAREAFTRAADSGQLSPELQQFVERQLRELALQKKK